MVQDVRSTATIAAFDLLSQEGIMHALAYVRASTATLEEKRELRDLIFSYSNTGGDPALRSLIENRLTTLPAPAIPLVNDLVSSPTVATEVTKPAVQTPTTTAGFSGGRPTPIFTTPTVSTVSVAEVLPVSTPPLSPTVPVPVSIPPTDLPVESFIPHSIPEPVAPMVPPAVFEDSARVPVYVAPVPPPAPAPAISVSVPVEPVAVIPDTLPVTPAPTEVPTVATPYQESASLDMYRSRITEIKQGINARVGNPVNLVDMNGAIGRAYMTALLEAMKVVSGGGGSVQNAMAKLETVVADVYKLLDATTQPASLEPVVSLTPPVPVKSVAMPAPVPTPVVPEAPAPISQPPVAPVSAPAITETEQEVVNVEAKIPVSPMEVPPSRVLGVPPVADAARLMTPQDLPTAAEVKARSGITDPLLDPDVDAGLDQLLSEWMLFKKSGIFGTGPKGRQHPLFIKIATIPVPLILSGRFEGATTEIKQSITDYMNGWRYEQGIIHENEESFEHYLRRVIRHIIDLQTRRRAS